MFIAPLFLRAKDWKQPRCPLADEWCNYLWYIHTMKDCSEIRSEALICSIMSVNVKDIKLSFFLFNSSFPVLSFFSTCFQYLSVSLQ